MLLEEVGLLHASGENDCGAQTGRTVHSQITLEAVNSQLMLEQSMDWDRSVNNNVAVSWYIQGHVSNNNGTPEDDLVILEPSVHLGDS